jgi:hypothetical protein
MENINTTMYKTGQPPCPINILTFLMIPFCCLSPVCWMTERNHNKRLDGVNKAKQKFNEDYGRTNILSPVFTMNFDIHNFRVFSIAYHF